MKLRLSIQIDHGMVCISVSSVTPCVLTLLTLDAENKMCYEFSLHWETPDFAFVTLTEEANMSNYLSLLQI